MPKIPFEDNQIHSTYSDGSKTLAEIFEYNHYHDKLDLTVTDHVDKNTDWFDKYAREIKILRKNYRDFKIKIGCEVKIIDESGTLNTAAQILKTAEVVIGSVHNFPGIKLLSAPELIKKEYQLTKLLAANKQIDILGHPFSMAKRLFNTDVPLKYVEDIYQTCLKHKIKLEYNKKNSPPSVKKLVKQEIAKGRINNFSFGSDMHDDLSEIGNSAFDIAPTINVLVTGAGAGVGQSIIKAVRLSNLKTRLIAVDNSHLAAGLYRADAARLIPLADDKDYIKKLVRICNQEDVNIIFPGTDVELVTLAKNKKIIEAATSAKLIISGLKTVKIADDKWKTANFLKNNGFPHPRSWLKPNPNILQFPMIIKPRVGARSIGFNIINNPYELIDKAGLIDNPIIQEYLGQDNQEYTCGALFYKGKNYGVVTAQRWLRNGDTYKAIFKHDPELEELVKRVGRRLNVSGPCNFQLRKTSRGPVIFEINCRFSGTTGAASYLGFNAANALMQAVCLNRPLKKLSFKESYMFRYWNELFTDPETVHKLNQDDGVSGHTAEVNQI